MSDQEIRQMADRYVVDVEDLWTACHRLELLGLDVRGSRCAGCGKEGGLHISFKDTDKYAYPLQANILCLYCDRVAHVRASAAKLSEADA